MAAEALMSAGQATVEGLVVQMTGVGLAPSMTGPVVGIDHVQIAAPVGCEVDARRFFGRLLGLEEIPKPASLAARGGCWFMVGGQQLHIGVDEEFAPAGKAHPALRVAPSRLEELAQRLVEAGSPVTWDDELAPLRRLYTVDPWGNRLELIAEPLDGQA